MDTPSDTQGHHLRRAGNARHVSRFNARWTAEQRSIIERAAALSGQSVSQFVLAAAHHAALDLIQQREVIVLSLQDSRKIREALENPPEPSADLRRAAEQYQALVREEN